MAGHKTAKDLGLEKEAAAAGTYVAGEVIKHEMNERGFGDKQDGPTPTP